MNNHTVRDLKYLNTFHDDSNDSSTDDEDSLNSSASSTSIPSARYSSRLFTTCQPTSHSLASH